MLRTGCLLAPQRDFVVTLRQSGLPYRRPPATALLGHYADRTLTGKFITAFRTHTTGPPPHPALLGRTRAFHPNRTGCPDRVGGAQDDSHVHRTIDRSGRHPALPRQHRRAYAADLRRGLPTDGQRRLRSQPPPQIPLRGRDGGCALHPGPYPPVSSRQSGYGASTTGSLTLYLLTLLDEPAPSGSAGTSRLCRGRLPPSPAFPGSGCPQLLPGRCDGPRETVSHHLSIYPAPRGALDRHSG